MPKELWNDCYSIVIPGKFYVEKHYDQLFFPRKKKILSDIPKMVVSAILRPNLRHTLEIENFFFSKYNLLVQFFGVKFTENYDAVGINP